jgi:hypothetical protein
MPLEMDDHSFSTILAQIGGHRTMKDRVDSCQGAACRHCWRPFARDGRIDP